MGWWIECIGGGTTLPDPLKMALLLLFRLTTEAFSPATTAAAFPSIQLSTTSAPSEGPTGGPDRDDDVRTWNTTILDDYVLKTVRKKGFHGIYLFLRVLFTLEL